MNSALDSILRAPKNVDYRKTCEAFPNDLPVWNIRELRMAIDCEMQWPIGVLFDLGTSVPLHRRSSARMIQRSAGSFNYAPAFAEAFVLV